MHTSAIAFHFLGRTVVVDAPPPELLELLLRRLGRMAAPAPPDPVARLHPRARPPLYSIDGIAAAFTLAGLARRLEYEIVQALVTALPAMSWFHAGAAARGGHAVLIAGPSGCGKSTLTLELCRRGWYFLSDDVTPLDFARGAIHPLLRTPLHRENPRANLPAEDVAGLARVSTDWGALKIAESPAPPAMLLFPTFDADAPLAMTEVAPADAVMRLVPCSLSFAADPAAGLAHLAALARATPAFSIRYHDGPQAAAAIAGAWERVIAGDAREL